MQTRYRAISIPQPTQVIMYEEKEAAASPCHCLQHLSADTAVTHKESIMLEGNELDAFRTNLGEAFGRVVKMPLETLAFHGECLGSTSSSVANSSFLANAAGDHPSTWVPATHVTDLG